jgi:hypothetical protein
MSLSVKTIDYLYQKLVPTKTDVQVRQNCSFGGHGHQFWRALVKIVLVMVAMIIVISFMGKYSVFTLSLVLAGTSFGTNSLGDDCYDRRYVFYV